MFTLKRFAAILAVAAGTAAHAAPTLVTDVSGSVTGIDSLDVAGVTYNVAFRDGSFDGLFGSTVPFANTSQAADAMSALFSALPLFPALDADPALMTGCENASVSCFILTAASIVDASTVDVYAVRNGAESQQVLNGQSALFWDRGLDTSGLLTNSLTRAYVWADWSPVRNAVSEPGSLALAGLAMVALANLRKRQRRA